MNNHLYRAGRPAPGGRPSARPPGAHELAMALRIAYMTMHRRANADFAPFGLNADQFILLTTLAEGEGMIQKELVRRTGSDPNTMSGMLARLERDGLVERERHAEDGRAWVVRLTARGRVVHRRAWEGNPEFREEMEGLFSPGVRQSLINHLGRIARAMESPGRPGTLAGTPLGRAARPVPDKSRGD
jgi:DNA-binding MarR family transcriptional regulator